MRIRGFGIPQFARARQSFSVTSSGSRQDRAPAPSKGATPRCTYVICTNPRSGSWLLSEGLSSTSLAGNPREWFNALEEQELRAQWRLDNGADPPYETYLSQVQARSTTSNGVCGVKLQYYQFTELHHKLAVIDGFSSLKTAELMSKAFPNIKYIWLTRRDKARQAISYQLASTTDEWWSIENSGRKGHPRHDESGFDPDAIAGLEKILIENDRGWESYFQNNGIAPLKVIYEDLAADYRGVLVSTLKWLGIPDADMIAIPPPRLRRQSDARNEEWLRRYLQLKAGGGRPAPKSVLVAINGPLVHRMQNPLRHIPAEWKQWIGRSRLSGTSDGEIVETLTANGYSREAAALEVKNAAEDPYLLAGAPVQRRLNKVTDLLNNLQCLAKLDPRSRAVERRSHLSREEFRDRYYAANRPVIIRDLMTTWRAMTAWTPDYLRSISGDQMVEIMSGRNADPGYEINSPKHRLTIRFADYIDRVYSGQVTNDYYMVANNSFFQRAAAQPLLKDFTAFPDYLKETPDGRQCFLWFGPAGTVTPLHHDACNILLAQVAGRKRYLLIPALQWQYVYNSIGVFSDVDCEKPDFALHPLFRNAMVTEVVLEPGEVLFLPVGWWHHVRALDVSMTISFTNFVFPNQFRWER